MSWAGDTTGPPDIYFTRISTAGDTIGDNLRITYGGGYSPSLVWTGSEFGVSSEEQFLNFSRISAQGVKTGSDLQVNNENIEYHSQSLAWAPEIGEFGVSWIERDQESSDLEVFFAQISTQGDTLGTPFQVTNDPENPATISGPSLAWTGSEFGLSWSRYISESFEVFFTRIQVRDRDGDKALDSDEVSAGTDPDNWDSDFDGIGDGWELGYPCMDPSSMDSALDYDSDALSNSEEYALNSDPCFSDPDGDGLSDWYEVNVSGTDPNAADTDSDGISDGFELGVVVAPGPDGVLDTTPAPGDSVHDNAIWLGVDLLPGSSAIGDDVQVIPVSPAFPRIFITDPNNPDNDNDGILDGIEVLQGANPLDASIIPWFGGHNT